MVTAEQEQAIARAIIDAERAVLEALVRATAGRAALASLGRELEAGRVDVRTLLLNPDEAGLDLVARTERLRSALIAAASCDERERTSVVDTLAAVRLDLAVVDRLIAAVQGAAEDATIIEGIAQARRHLRHEKERLVTANLRLVLLFAHKYRHQGMPLLDLVQEGNLGLKSRDTEAVLTALNETLTTCTTCHQAFKQRVVDDATWTKATNMTAPSAPMHH